MPKYHYDGRDASGKMVNGVVDAKSDAVVAQQLIRSGISPINIVLYQNEATVEGIAAQFKLGYPTLEDLAFFSRQMYSLTRSGVPLVRTIRVVSESVKNDYLKLALRDVINSVEQGQALAQAMNQHPLIFPSLMISLVNVGENTGSLDAVFQQLSAHFERELNTRRQVKEATRYPIIVLVVIAIAIVIMNIFVIPAFANFFKQFHAELPLPTRILIGFSDFMVHDWPWLIGGIVLVVGSIVYYLKTPKGRYNWDRAQIRIPIIGIIIQQTLLARYARTFALCLRTGVPLLEAIGLIAKATDNVYVADKIMGMRNSIEHGESLTASAMNSQMFTPLVLQMLSVGEETGEIDRLLDEVATYYEQEVDYKVKRLGALIEPIILVFLGALVLLLALAIYLPMWNLSTAALGK